MATMDDAADRVVGGRYRLLGSLGAGGMGRVWLAHDQELDCEVVLKELAVPSDMPEPERAARIARARAEARHSARLRGNPHVVTVYDCVLDDGLPWIVMEYVPGARDLETVVRDKGPLSPATAARVGLALLDALAAGHRMNILHRDVKPSNVLVTSSDLRELDSTGEGRVLLTDYGISLREHAGEPRLTTESGVIGTPGYLAPERARDGEPTPASDMFALGATLYFAVEGRGPFDRGTPVATFTALLTEEPTPPRRAGRMTPVILGLLAKDPARRLGADAATGLLTQLTAPGPPTQPVTITPSSSPPPKPERRKVRRVVVAAGAVLVAGLVPWLVLANTGPAKQTTHAEPPRSPSAAVPLKPYGDAVGLLQQLSPGDCVTAHWIGERFARPPQLTLVDCRNGTPDGQVYSSDRAMSVPDAQVNGYDRCASDTKGTVDAMADARAYSLSPTDKGWKNGVHSSACFVFNKTTNIGSDVGKFRKAGAGIGLQNSQIGDCYNDRVDKSGSVTDLLLTRCDSPHDDQVVGFVKEPATSSYKSIEGKEGTLCRQRFSAYDGGVYAVWGYADEDGWKSGFRYLQCDVYRTDGKKLSSSLLSASP